MNWIKSKNINTIPANITNDMMNDLNPANNIALQNIEFDDCMIGIHFIDQCISYNHLNLNTVVFNNLVYGIKFEIDSYENSKLYNFKKANDYLINTNSLFDSNTISKGEIYCPVNGILKAGN